MGDKNKKQIKYIIIGQMLSNISSALLLIIGFLVGKDYYLGIQEVMSVLSLAGLLHLGVADAIFQKQLDSRKVKLNYNKVKIFVCLVTCVGCVFVMLIQHQKYFIVITVGAIIANLMAINNAINNGKGQTYIYIRSLIYEKTIFILIATTIIIIDKKIEIYWLLIPIAIGYIYNEIKTKYEKNIEKEEVILEYIKNGMGLMLMNLTYSGMIPVSIIAVIRSDIYFKAEIVLSLTICGLLVSYFVQLNTLFLGNREIEIINKKKLIFFYMISLVIMGIFAHEIGFIKEISLVPVWINLLMLTPYIFIEYYNQTKLIVELRLNNKVKKIMKTNIIIGLVYIVIIFAFNKINFENINFIVAALNSMALIRVITYWKIR
jgi:hypothetical protein